MADPIAEIRTATEDELAALLGKLNRKARKAIVAAIERYGSVNAIPPEFWEGLKREADQDAAALMILLLMTTYRTQNRRLRRQAPAEAREALGELGDDEEALRSQTAGPAARLGRQIASDYVDGVQQSVGKKLGNGQFGSAYSATKAREAVRDATSIKRVERVVITRTTDGITAAQNAAGEDAQRATGIRVKTVWVTEQDAKVCFPAGTLVATEAGDKPIESIEVGERVKVRVGYCAVVATSKREYTGPMITVRTAEHEVTATADHPFWTLENLWVAAADLSTRFTLCDVDYNACPIVEVIKSEDISSLLEPSETGPTGPIKTLVYDLQVDEHPEFFAGGVLVHNCPICRPLHNTDVGEWEAITARNGADSDVTASVRYGPPAHPNCRCELKQTFVST